MKKTILFTVLFTVFIDIIGFGIIVPLLPFYAKEFGANEFVIGFLLASTAIGQFFFNPIWGRISDKYGRRPIMMVTVIGSSIAYFIFGAASTLAVLFLSRILTGVGGASIGVAQSIIADCTEKKDRAKYMGYIGAAFGMGFVFGPAISGFLFKYGYGVPGFFASGLSVINLICVIAFLPETNNKKKTKEKTKESFDWESLKTVLKSKDVVVVLLAQFLIMFSASNLFSTFALFFNAKYGYGVKETAYMFTYFGLMSALVQGVLIGRIVKIFGEEKVLIIGSLSISFSLGIMPFLPNIYYLVVFAAFFFFGNGLINPSISSLISQKANDEQVGVTLGVSQSLGSLSRILGPIWGGAIFYYAGYIYPYITGSISSFIVFLITAKFFLKKEPQKLTENI